MRPDFSLIWGSDNAPFTPIEASDYTAGWVFRTGAPPRRVNFDYFQNLSDQRAIWLDQNKANLDSPIFTGTPTAPSPSTGVRSQALATMQKFADEFGSSLATSGWQKLPSGLIVQWGLTGTFSHAAGTTQSAAVTFPIAFPTARLALILSHTSVEFTSGWGAPASLSMFTAQSRAITGAGSGPIYWLAIGY